MPDEQISEQQPEQAPAYEAPVVDDLESPDGPAVTAAGVSQTG